jgi:hypothetical protein
MTPARRRNLDAATSKGLQGIVRVSDEPFDLDAMLARFDGVFGPGRR